MNYDKFATEHRKCFLMSFIQDHFFSLIHSVYFSNMWENCNVHLELSTGAKTNVTPVLEVHQCSARNTLLVVYSANC